MLEKDKTHSNGFIWCKMLHLDDHYKSKSKSSIILLTGASGFIGKSFLKHAISLGLRVCWRASPMTGLQTPVLKW